MPEWLIPVIVAIVAATPGVYAVYRQTQKDKTEREEDSREDSLKQRLEVDRAIWEKAGATIDRQERKIADMEAEIRLLEARLVLSDEMIVQLEKDINRYVKLLEEKDRTIEELEKKLASALKENQILKKKLGEK